MNGDLSNYKSRLQHLHGAKETIEGMLNGAKKELKTREREEHNCSKALVILQEVAKETQEQLQYHINELVTLALSAVFDDPYEFDTEFQIKRNKSEAFMSFVRDGMKVHPMSATGGGAVDVASFALRPTMWSLMHDNPRNAILLDEPFKFLSKDLQPKAGEMLKQLSKKLGLQFIIVTHNQDLIESADRLFEVSIKNGVSLVKEVK